MKKIIFSCAVFVMIVTITYAQTTPDAVAKAFQKKFPDVKDAKWKKENAHEYEASFTSKGQHLSANFNDKGDWLETESPMAGSSLPQKVKDAFQKAYPGIAMKEVYKIEKPGNIIHYEIEYKKGTKTSEAIFDADGKKV